jgi:hypothetical protein
LSVGDRIEHVDLIELDPPDAMVVLRHWPRQAATGARIMRDAGIIDDITPDAFADLAGRCTVYRIHTARTWQGNQHRSVETRSARVAEKRRHG